MDGAPVRGESIPIRVFLAGYDLAPTMRDINKKFSVRYYLNLVLMDEEDRRYFKQQVSDYTVRNRTLKIFFSNYYTFYMFKIKIYFTYTLPSIFILLLFFVFYLGDYIMEER